MINTSLAYKNTLYNGHRNFIRKATIYLADGTELSISDSDIWSGGFKFESATTSSGSFEIGNVIIGKFTMLLNNIYDTYSSYDFYGAIIWVYTGLILDDETEEWFRKGVYIVKESDFSSGVVTLVCYDNISRFDIPYSNSNLTYPATRQEVVADICNICGVTNNTGEFDGWDEIIEKRPEDSSITCRDMLTYIAQVSGLYGCCDNAGSFKFAWYESIQYDGGDISSTANLDGGNFTDYTSGDTADGGNFTDYSSGDSYDGGVFFSGAPDVTGNFHNVYSTSNSNIGTDDITITGIKVVTTTERIVSIENQYTDSETGETITESSVSEETAAFEALSGTNEYVLVISDNPLINDGNAQGIADHLFEKIGGLTIRPMTISALGDPSMEAGDAMIHTDRKGNTYVGYITTLSYTIGQYANITCDAESPLTRKNQSENSSKAIQTVIEMQNVAKKQASRYAQAADQLNQLAANALGFYETVKVDSNGSKIVYMHDKPSLEESQIIYKKSIDGFFVSTDGGKTYVSGFASNGNAVLNILSAIGINFDWASGGTLTLGGSGNGNGILKIIDETGNLVVSGTKDGLNIYKGSISFQNVTGTENVATTDDIPTKTSELTNDSGYQNSSQVTQITKDTVTSTYIKGLNLTVGNEIQMGANAKISWANVTGTENVATLDDIDSFNLDFRNLALGTSDEWIEATVTDVTNCCVAAFTLENMNEKGLKAGDILQVSLDLKFSDDFTATGTGTKASYIQGDMNQGGTWTSISLTGGNKQSGIETIIASTSKTGHINTFFVVTASMVNGTYSGNWKINIRFDYYSGKVYYRNQVINRGDREILWQPASEDISQSISQSAVDVLTEINSAGYQTIDEVEAAISDAFANADLMTDEKVTLITKNTVTTSYINALAITAKAVAADWVYAGSIGAEQITANTLSSIAANIGQLVIDGYLTTNKNRTVYNQALAGLTIDSNGIGGWGSASKYFNLTNNGELTAYGATINGEITTISGNWKTRLMGGCIRLYNDDTAIGRIAPIAWGNDYENAQGVMLSTDSTYLSLGREVDGSYTAAYVLNNGLNPDDCTERNIFYGTARFKDKIYLTNDSYIYTVKSNDVAGAYFSGSLSVESYVTMKKSLYIGGNYYADNYALYVDGTARIIDELTVGDFRVPQVQHGSIEITPSAANTPTGKAVTFPAAFSGTSKAVATPRSASPGKAVLGVSVLGCTDTGMTIYLTRTDTTTTGINWIAIY